MKKHFIRKINFLFIGVILSLPSMCLGATKEKIIYTTVGKSFYINPWSDLGYSGKGYHCASTFCKVDAQIFSMSTFSTTQTFYPDYSHTTERGKYETYKITALKAGDYTINAGADCRKRDGIDYYAGNVLVLYHIIVSEKPIVKSISIPSEIGLKIGEDYTFTPIIVDEGAETTLSWNSSDASVVSINKNGTIKALTAGTSMITCTASNGVSAKSLVSVKPILTTNISLNYVELEIEKGTKFVLEATILPVNVTSKEVIWKSSNENVAFVGFNGTVVGVSAGYCNITATTKDGSNKSASCIVHVLDVPETEKDFEPIGITPAESSKVETLKTIVLEFEKIPNLAAKIQTITLVGKDTLLTVSISVKATTLEISLSDSLKTAGEYTLTIPEGTFGDADFAVNPITGHCNPELVYTFTIKEPQSDTPSSITETQQTDGHVMVYNLQGVPVLETDDADDLKTLQHGAYIVNGKKMIIAR